MKPALREGFTTGTAAAAAAKAASISALTGDSPKTVTVTLPGALRTLAINVHSVVNRSGVCTASVIKDGGDDPDVTSGLLISAAVRLINDKSDKVVIKGGDGVGVVTKAGLQCPVGSHAVNPVPRAMITKAVRETVPDGLVEVEIIVPDGQRVAERTFNRRLGIVGGISIIGTTGIVKPMSVEAIKATIACELDVAFEEDASRGYLSPGKIGEDALKAIFHGAAVVQMSNFIGDALLYARGKGFKGVVIGGHPGKLAKLLMGYFDTHSARSPQAAGFVANYFGLEGEYNTVEEIVDKLRDTNGFDALAYDIAVKIKAMYTFSSVEVWLFDMKKRTIGTAACTG